MSFGQSNEAPNQDTSLRFLEDIGEVVISATRTNKNQNSVPLPVVIINREEIINSNFVTLEEAINEQSGLITIPDYGGGEGIQIQGFDSEHVLILMDGVPIIGRLAGTLDLKRFNLGNVERIEIVKGASSSLYGNEALGGVVNIISKSPEEGVRGDVNYRGSTWNTHDINTNLGFSKDNFGITSFFDHNRSGGYDLTPETSSKTVSPFYNFTSNTRISYTFSPKTSLTVTGRYYGQTQDYSIDSSNGESTIDEWNVTAKLDADWKGVELCGEVYISDYSTFEFIDNAQSERVYEARYDQRLFRPELRSVFNVNSNQEFIVGIGLNHEELVRSSFWLDPSINTLYSYAQYDASFFKEKINFIVGARFDNHQEYKSQLSPKVAIQWNGSEKFNLKTSLAYGFKAPDFRQLYFDFSNSSVGYTVLGYNAVPERLSELDNQGEIIEIIIPISEYRGKLQAENSLNFNFGLNYNPSKKLLLDANFFYNRVKDLIDTRVIARKTNGQNVFSYHNIDEISTFGCEFNLKWIPSDNLRISSGYQLLYAYDRAAIDEFNSDNVFGRLAPNQPVFRLERSDYFGLLNRSRHMANIKIFASIPRVNCDVNLRGTFRSKYGLFDSNNNNYLDDFDVFVDGYSIWDIALSKEVLGKFRVALGMDNVFNFTDADNISNIPGRSIYSKISFSFNS